MSPYTDPPVSPYDPSYPDYESQKRPLDQVIRDALFAHTLGIKVCLPAKVAQVMSNQVVNIQPTLQVRYIEQSSGTNLPILQNVPVSMPMGQGYSIKLPIAVGDTGYCIFSDRSLDAWLAGNGSVVDPQDARQHDISDAIFVPGLVPFSNQTNDSTTDLVITNGVANIHVEKAGKFKLQNSQNELMNLLVEITTEIQSLSQTLSTDTVNTIYGPTKLNAFATYSNIASQLNDLLSKLETLQG